MQPDGQTAVRFFYRASGLAFRCSTGVYSQQYIPGAALANVAASNGVSTSVFECFFDDLVGLFCQPGSSAHRRGRAGGFAGALRKNTPGKGDGHFGR